MTQPSDPNQPDSYQPGYTPPPRAVDYQTPRSAFWGDYNRWWMVLLRVLGGMVLGALSMGGGIWLAFQSSTLWVMAVPPLVVLSVLLFVCLRFRRYGYITGFLSFIIASFLVVAGLIALLYMICGR